MKNILIYIAIMMTFSIAGTNLYAEQEHPFSDHVSKLWFDGEKNEVLNIANYLLANKSDDIVGLILKLEYELEFLLLDDSIITINKILENIDMYNTPKLLKKRDFLQDELLLIKNDLIPNYPPEELGNDRAKANISKKPMSFRHYIIAAEEDELVSMNSIAHRGNRMKGNLASLSFGIIFLIIGIIFLFWPEKVQEYTLKGSNQGLGKFYPFLSWMKSRSYILTLRIFGLLAIGAAILAFYVVVKTTN